MKVCFLLASDLLADHIALGKLWQFLKHMYELEEEDNSFIDLETLYPTLQIDAKAEQQRVLEADIICILSHYYPAVSTSLYEWWMSVFTLDFEKAHASTLGKKKILLVLTTHMMIPAFYSVGNMYSLSDILPKDTRILPTLGQNSLVLLFQSKKDLQKYPLFSQEYPLLQLTRDIQMIIRYWRFDTPVLLEEWVKLFLQGWNSRLEANFFLQAFHEESFCHLFDYEPCNAHNFPKVYHQFLSHFPLNHLWELDTLRISERPSDNHHILDFFVQWHSLDAPKNPIKQVIFHVEGVFLPEDHHKTPLPQYSFQSHSIQGELFSLFRVSTIFARVHPAKEKLIPTIKGTPSPS